MLSAEACCMIAMFKIKEAAMGWEGDNDNGPRMVRFCACVICF